MEKAGSKHLNLEKIASAAEDDVDQNEIIPLKPEEVKFIKLDKSSDSNSS